MQTATSTPFSHFLPFHFLLHFPFKRFCRGTFLPARKNRAAFLVGESHVSLLVEPPASGSRGEGAPQPVLAYHSDLYSLNGSPSLREALSDANLSGLREKILEPHRLQADGQFVFVIDSPECYLNLHTVDSRQFSSNAAFRQQLLEQTASLIPTWDGSEAFLWELLTPELLPAQEDQLNDQLMVIGIPARIPDNLIHWSKLHQGLAQGIVPGPIAVAGWLQEHLVTAEPLRFLLCCQAGQTVMFAFHHGKCIHLQCLRSPQGRLWGNLRELRCLLEEITQERSPGAMPPLYYWLGEADPQTLGPVNLSQKLWGHSVFLDRKTIAAQQPLGLSQPVGQENAFLLDWALQRVLGKGASTPAKPNR